MFGAVTEFIAQNASQIALALIVSTALLLIGSIVLFSRLGRLTRLYSRLTRNTSGGNLEGILQEYMTTVRAVDERLGRLEQRVDCLAEAQRGCLQRIGVVRFDAFEEVGGEQSFAVAITDADHSGVVLSSVFSRRDMRVYAKALESGRPSHPLSEEERKALALAEGR